MPESQSSPTYTANRQHKTAAPCTHHRSIRLFCWKRERWYSRKSADSTRPLAPCSHNIQYHLYLFLLLLQQLRWNSFSCYTNEKKKIGMRHVLMTQTDDELLDDAQQISTAPALDRLHSRERERKRECLYWTLPKKLGFQQRYTEAVCLEAFPFDI